MTALMASSELYVVAIGASAGGLAALESFFGAVPAGCDLAFVVVTHSQPDHTSLMPKLLARQSQLPVKPAQDRDELTGGQVYVAPPGVDLQVESGRLLTVPAPRDRVERLPIDAFFRSLAATHTNHAACVVLSGTGSDGTLGAKAIKGAGGLVMAQDLTTAAYDGMPGSVVAAGIADYVLPPAAMPEALIAYAHGRLAPESSVPDNEITEAISKALDLVRAEMGHDFSVYKSKTIRRRIERRMQVHRLTRPADYLRYAEENGHEVELLFRELLIGVTSFFRDAEAFAVLEERVVPALVAEKSAGAVLRAWVPGCATGEEAFSLAILFQECMERAKKPLAVQIFATDLDARAVEAARTGAYPLGIAADVRPERLARYFDKDGAVYRVRPSVREMIVFATQNVTHDPPFMNIDLLACRNLLIYLKTETQAKLLPIFHYALNPGGTLFLGSSESLGVADNLFEPIDKKWKIYRRQETGARPPLEFPSTPRRDRANAPSGVGSASKSQLIGRLLLDRFVPPAVVVNARGDIIHIHGRTGRYLEPAPGQPGMNLVRMAREGLQLALVNGIRQADKDGDTVIQRGVRVRTNGAWEHVDVSVAGLPQPGPLAGLLVVTFEPSSVREVEPDERTPPPESSNLEQELQYARDNLRTTVEELETSNEELRTTNEEMQSSNEELQSTNEELETSKEELQSVNEELHTVNAELQIKVDQLSAAHDDMRNLLESTEIATLFLDRELRIKRFTSEARKIVNVIDSDVGRPVADLASSLVDGSLSRDAGQVLADLEPRDVEVRGQAGEWYQMRIRPYRTTDNAIDGLVLTFVDVTPLKRALDASRLGWAIAEGLTQAGGDPIVLLNDRLEVVFSNPAFGELCGANVPRGGAFLELAKGRWRDARVTDLLERARGSVHGEVFHTTVADPESPRNPLTIAAQALGAVATGGAGSQILVRVSANGTKPGQR